MGGVLDLGSACAKLRRALTHLESLGDSFETMSEKAATRLALAPEERSPHGATFRHLFRVGELVPPPPEAPLIVGDYVQNLRAALDHVAWELVAKGSDPKTRDPLTVKFPIFDRAKSKGDPAEDESAFQKSMVQALPGVGEEERRVVLRHQSLAAEHWQLQALARLSNRDKHRVVTPTRLLSVDKIERRHLKATIGNVVRWRQLLADGVPLDEHTPLLEVFVDHPDARVDLLVKINTPVAFEEAPNVYRFPQQLVEVGETVAKIVGEFAAGWGRSNESVACSSWSREGRNALGLASAQST